MLATAVAALTFAVILGRWRPVSTQAYRPALEVD